jgi:hypothetical protein
VENAAEATMQVLTEHGWAQGHGEVGGRLCVTWAAYKAHGCQVSADTVMEPWDEPTKMPAATLQAATFVGRLNHAARELFPDRVAVAHPGTEAILVNDHPATTLEDVLLIIKHAGA